MINEQNITTNNNITFTKFISTRHTLSNRLKNISLQNDFKFLHLFLNLILVILKQNSQVSKNI